MTLTFDCLARFRRVGSRLWFYRSAIPGVRLLSGNAESTMDITPRKKLDTVEAADYLGLGKSTLDKLRLTGGGPAFYKVGARVVYEPADLDAWIAQHKRRSTSDDTTTAA
jgi:predicted DNA-binding transcriptional regulator AlpA